ncbi:conjugal transfer protein TraN [Vibrio coralliilyticus]|uniref:Conjugal transfer protein TraN n=1 Tax=Vibrio coralliilyticus TaxID=190893 RepID=A0AAP6ZNG5_9VIBR|nr:conjugal transfer protein TraN [Vibrio coralliilyticus]NOI31847.1 hypothetical protein [Vibrio coralliilyticus]NOJ25291.1 hypothetical protein [Vibrio coralliilyticus]
MLKQKFDGVFGQMISCTLIVTTTLLPLRLSYAQSDFDKAVSEANTFSTQLLNNRAAPTYDSNGNLLVDGVPYMSREQITGQRDNDYVPASTDTYGSDAQTLYQAQAAQAKYEEKTLETAETSSERAYHIIKKSINTQKPDLTNDPMWANTDHVLENLEEIVEDFASCTVETQLVSTGKDYHVPKYEQCERLPAIEENFTIGHEYKVGVIQHKSGPVNMLSCGDGCLQIWIGTVGDNYWSGWCTVYEESMSVEVLQPNKITYAKLARSKFDDYHQVYLNGTKIYNGPNSDFPPETSGPCELSTSWDLYPNVNITNSFTDVAPNTEVQFKTRTSASGNGEGFSSLLVYYDQEDLVYDDVWYDQDLIDKAITIKSQIADGYCTGSIRCADMPTLDSNGCTTINGITVCENNFSNNPVSSLGISPFCKRIEVSSDCNFNEGQICFTDMNGDETCFDNDTVENDQCQKYEEDPSCSFVKSECVEGAEGPSGNCYVQEDTFDCGFTANSGTPVEEEVITCDGQLQCVGENCYSPTRDGSNTDFAQVNAYLEMLKYARSDMTCEGIPEAPYNEDSPPDRYAPIPSCGEGYTFNSVSQECLIETGCSYTDDDFYAASPRNGVQIVVNDQIIANETSLSSCTPLTLGGITYTCGEPQKKLSTDTYYEVCTNDASPMTPNTCPSEGHLLNPDTGYCEVAPVPTCPDGVPLVEGDDPWSIDDDKCLLEVPATPECNQSNETYNASTGMCEGVATTNPICAEGNLNSSGLCSFEASECRYNNTNYVLYFNENYSEPIAVWDNVWIGRPIPSPYYQGIYRESGVSDGAVRLRYVGYELCRTTSETSLPSGCPSGYTYQNGLCTSSSSSVPTMTCSQDGTYYDVTTDSCRREETASLGCPSTYPVWNEAEQRCTAKSLSPLAAQWESPKKASSEVTQQRVLALVLAPFESILSSLVSEATADSQLVSEEDQVSQDSMNAYIATQYSDMAATYENDLALYEAGNEQLTQIVAYDSSSVPVNSDTGGEQNVTCELFKGEAMECKVAVGGMQDCCESPVKPSLADYISMTTKMMQMDALTGEVLGLEGYTGAWDMASNWTSDIAGEAWSAVEGAFTTGADVAGQEAIKQGATEAGEGVMASVAQSMMQYTNQFLIDTFGEEVASMFFQEVVLQTGATQVAPSAAMANVGAALTVIYYAYLAYVVFNLLIGIVFACEDEEMDLAMKRELLSTHYIGTYCKTEVLGACIEKRRSYCVFDSPLSRIMMEQIYAQPQMNLSWGTTEAPNCTGLAIDQMENIEWDLVNLDEWVGILIQTDNYTDMVNVDIDSLTGAGSNLNYQQGGVDRDNVLETNQSRMEDIDADEVRRDAYEDAWEKSQ